MTDAPDLKPCPFCGAAMQDFHGHSFVHPLVADRNDACILSGLSFSYVHSRWGTDERARWNRLATLPDPDDAARIAALEEANARLREAAEYLAKWDHCWPGNINLERTAGMARAALEAPE
jgi:hypothetical protein